MNIINYIYDKGKKIYNISSNVSSNTSSSLIENENLITKITDTSNNNSSFSYKHSTKRCHKYSVSPSHFLKLNVKILKKKKGKNKNAKSDGFVNRDSDRNSECDLSDIYKNKEEYQESQGCLEYKSFNKNGRAYKTNDSNVHVGSGDDVFPKKKWRQKYNKKEKVQEKEEENVENGKKKKTWCTDPSFNEHILAQGGFKVDYIRHDKKIYQNRCDGVCALNDNIYIFDKIKKCIYLYTPYNNVWHIFLGIYEEVATKRKGNVSSVSDHEHVNEKEKNIHPAENFKYLNNISFTNYTDMVFLNNCIFVISSNSQFMNMCKVNIENMNTIFNTIIVDSVNERVPNFEEILKSIKKKNKQTKGHKEELCTDKQNAKREDTAEEVFEKNTSVEKYNALKYSSLMKKETYSETDVINVEYLTSNSGKDNFSNCNESEECNEYTKGAFEIGNYLKNNDTEKENTYFEKKRKKEKKIIKPRDLFSLCSVNESCYSLMYLFGGKGNSVKHKNEYVDNIYNDLYVYDFYKNKWFELYIYKPVEKEPESSNSVLNGEMYKHSSNERAMCNEFPTLESKIETDQCQFKKDFASWTTERAYKQAKQTEETDKTERSVTSRIKCSQTTKAANSKISSVLNEGSGSSFPDLGPSELFQWGEEKKESSSDALKTGRSDYNVPTISRINRSRSNDINLIKLNSNSNSVTSYRVDSSSSVCAGNRSTEMDSTMLLKTKRSTVSEKCAMLEEKMRKNSFCVTCANNVNSEKGKKVCTYICDLQKNNIRLRKIKWLHRRAGHSCVYYKNNLYIFGGISYYSFTSNKINLKFCNNLYLYNIESNECFEILTKGKIPEKRYRHSCVLINDYMFILGGETQNSTLPKNDLFYYNFSNSVWTEINLSSQVNFHSLYKTVWLENFGSIYMFGSSILRLTKKDFQYTPAYKNKRRGTTKKNSEEQRDQLKH